MAWFLILITSFDFYDYGAYDPKSLYTFQLNMHIGAIVTLFWSRGILLFSFL